MIVRLFLPLAALVAVIPPAFGQMSPVDQWNLRHTVERAVEDAQRRSTMIRPQAPVATDRDEPRRDVIDASNIEEFLRSRRGAPSGPELNALGSAALPRRSQRPERRIINAPAMSPAQMDAVLEPQQPTPEPSRAVEAVSGNPPESEAQRHQRDLVKSFPALGVPGSPLNREFVARVKARKEANPSFFEDPLWPNYLALESVETVLPPREEGKPETPEERAYLQVFNDTVEAGQERAIRLYPEVMNPKSAMAREMVRLDKNLEKTNDPLFYHASKPLVLTRRAAANLGIAARPAAVAP